MVPYAHKQIPGATVTAFHDRRKQTNAASTEWETGPCMRSIELNNVTVTHWGGEKNPNVPRAGRTRC